MNVYDKAYELAKALKESGDYRDTLEATRKVDADPEAKRMLDDFRQRQMEIQQRMMSGDMPPKEEMEKLEKIFEVINMNPEVRKLFDAERRLSVIMEDVQKIISEPLREIFQ